jgi:hypothetical protein
MKNIDVTAPGKLAALCLVVVGCFVYIIVSLIQAQGADTTPAWALLTLVVGYLIGNGTGAAKGVPTVAPFAPTPERQIERLAAEIVDRDG